MQIEHSKVWHTPSDISVNDVDEYIAGVRARSVTTKTGNKILTSALNTFLMKRVLVTPDVYYRTYQGSHYYRVIVMTVREDKLCPEGLSIEDMSPKDIRNKLDEIFFLNFPDKATYILNTAGQRSLGDGYHLLIGVIITDEPVDIEYVKIGDPLIESSFGV